MLGGTVVSNMREQKEMCIHSSCVHLCSLSWYHSLCNTILLPHLSPCGFCRLTNNRDCDEMIIRIRAKIQHLMKIEQITRARVHTKHSTNRRNFSCDLLNLLSVREVQK